MSPRVLNSTVRNRSLRLKRGIHDIRTSEIGDSERSMSLRQLTWPLSRDTAYLKLQECIQRKDLASGRFLHSLMVCSGLDRISSLGDHLIRLFGTNGDIFEACLAFCRLSQTSIYTWEAIISAHVANQESDKAVMLYYRMQDYGIFPGKFVFLGTLKACTIMEDLSEGRLIHVDILRSSLDPDLVVECTVLNMYAQCKVLEDARKVFDDYARDDVAMWNAMIAAYAQQGHGTDAFNLFEKMKEKRLEPDKVTCLCLLKACSAMGSEVHGWVVHHQVIQSGFESDTVICNTLVDMYAKCGGLHSAGKMFSIISVKNVVTWNAIITGYAECGQSHVALQLFKNMKQEGLEPDKVTFLSLLKSCSTARTISEGKLIHDEILNNGLGSDVSLGNALIHMYAQGCKTELAREVFDSILIPDMISWGSIISAYAENNPKVAFQLFEDMHVKNIKPEKVVILCLMKACANLEDKIKAFLVHHQIVELSFDSHTTVLSTLIDMHGKCKNVDEALDIFEKLPKKDAISWSSIIAALAQNGPSSTAFQFFERMQQEGVEPDRITYLLLLKLCSNIQAIDWGKRIQDQLLGNDIELDVMIGTTLVDMHIKFGDVDSAREVFDKMATKNKVTWSAMIAGYIQYGHYLLALEILEKMREAGHIPDKVMMLGILKASASVGAVGPGMLVHDQIIRDGIVLDQMLGNTLLDMYAKCGRVQEADKVFTMLSAKDVVSWSALIAGHSQHGNYKLALQTLEKMKMQGIAPADSTYTSILAACCHAGRVEDAQQQFVSMTENHNIKPTIEHFNCMIDLLARGALFPEAKEVIQSMPIPPDMTSWMSLLTACRLYKNVELGKFCFDEAVKLDGSVAAAYVLMSDIYANANMWDDVQKIQQLRQSNHALEKPRLAWVENEGKLHDKNYIEGEYVPIWNSVSNMTFDGDWSQAGIDSTNYAGNEDCVEADKNIDSLSMNYCNSFCEFLTKERA